MPCVARLGSPAAEPLRGLHVSPVAWRPPGTPERAAASVLERAVRAARRRAPRSPGCCFDEPGSREAAPQSHGGRGPLGGESRALHGACRRESGRAPGPRHRLPSGSSARGPAGDRGSPSRAEQDPVRPRAGVLTGFSRSWGRPCPSAVMPWPEGAVLGAGGSAR